MLPYTSQDAIKGQRRAASQRKLQLLFGQASPFQAKTQMPEYLDQLCLGLRMSLKLFTIYLRTKSNSNIVQLPVIVHNPRTTRLTSIRNIEKKLYNSTFRCSRPDYFKR